MDEVSDLTSPGIRAALLRLKSKWQEGKADSLECVRGAYDAIATVLIKDGKLNESDLCQRIPELVFEVAVEFKWIPYPRRQEVPRRRTIPGSYIPDASVNDWVSIPIPKAKLVEQVGRFQVEAGFRARFESLLSGRIAFWQAKILDEQARVSTRRIQDDTASEADPGQELLVPRVNTSDLSGRPLRDSSCVPDFARPRRTPDLRSSRERVELANTLARELAIIKQEIAGYCTAEELKRKHPNFALWNHIEDSQVQALVDGEEFTPKAYAENLTLTKFGLTSRETLKKDRRKLRKAGKAARQ